MESEAEVEAEGADSATEVEHADAGDIGMVMSSRVAVSATRETAAGVAEDVAGVIMYCMAVWLSSNEMVDGHSSGTENMRTGTADSGWKHSMTDVSVLAAGVWVCEDVDVGAAAAAEEEEEEDEDEEEVDDDEGEIGAEVITANCAVVAEGIGDLWTVTAWTGNAMHHSCVSDNKFHTYRWVAE
jgi:hypothetical protein